MVILEAGAVISSLLIFAQWWSGMNGYLALICLVTLIA